MNFDGPVRVAESAGAGTATVTLSFDAWEGAGVAPTTHAVPVLAAKAAAKAEPTAPNLIASLAHPVRKANVYGVNFSPDGKRLFAAGYTSGVVQVWDWAAKKEVRRFETTPPGYHGSADYALFTPDGATLYVPVEKRKDVPVEKDGKKGHRVEYTGRVRVWDVTTGEEKEPLQPAEGSAPAYAKLSPDGRSLVCVERPTDYDNEPRAKEVTVVWDLAAGGKRKLRDGFADPSFAPDGKTVAVALHDHDAQTSVVKLLDLADGKQRAEVSSPEKGRHLTVGAFCPDGTLLAVFLSGKKASPMEVWFLDAKTLEDRGKLVSKGNPEGYGWGGGVFTPDGKRFVALDGAGNAVVWDVAGRKVERTVPLGSDRPSCQLALSPNGETLAVGWAPKPDAEVEGTRKPDPRDLPQPRVTLLDLAGDARPRVLIAPHGHVGGLAFSPDGKTLAFGGAGAVHLFDLTK